MRILVTNDDGIHAPGLLALANGLRDLGEVVIVAPSRERSGASHSLTIDRPVFVHPTSIDGLPAWAVDGTPVDAVLLAFLELLDPPPDFVASGINRGANLGEDILYSGTVACAREGALRGARAAAFSVGNGVGYSAEATHFDAAVSCARWLVPLAAAHLPPDVALNVNVPPLPADQIAGIEVCRQGRRFYRTAYDSRVDPRGRAYYWLGGTEPDGLEHADCDVGALRAGRIAITPVQLDVTDRATLEAMRAWARPPE